MVNRTGRYPLCFSGNINEFWRHFFSINKSIKQKAELKYVSNSSLFYKKKKSAYYNFVKAKDFKLLG